MGDERCRSKHAKDVFAGREVLERNCVTKGEVARGYLEDCVLKRREAGGRKCVKYVAESSGTNRVDTLHNVAVMKPHNFARCMSEVPRRIRKLQATQREEGCVHGCILRLSKREGRRH